MVAAHEAVVPAARSLTVSHPREGETAAMLRLSSSSGSGPEPPPDPPEEGGGPPAEHLREFLRERFGDVPPESPTEPEVPEVPEVPEEPEEPGPEESGSGEDGEAGDWDAEGDADDLEDPP
jgi:hypothetical protein